jgi:hypothetical protein
MLGDDWNHIQTTSFNHKNVEKNTYIIMLEAKSILDGSL